MTEAENIILEAMDALCDDDAEMRTDMLHHPFPSTLVKEVEGILTLYRDDEEVWDLVCDAVYRYDEELNKYFY